METAARRRTHRRRHLAGDDLLRTARLDLRVGDRDRRQQRLRIGVQRLGVELGARRDLDDAAEIHHRDAMTDMAHNREIVGDEDVGEAQPFLQFLEQIHDLRLDRDVERRYRLVAEDQRRLQGQRAGNANALALSAREFVRIAVGHVGQQAHHVEQLGDLLAIGGAPAGQAMDLERLADDLRHLHARVQRPERVLIDHLHAPPDGPHAGTVVLGNVLALEHDLARGDVEHLEDGEAGRALAAAGLSHQPQRLATAHGEGDTVDGLHAADLLAHHGAGHDREMNLEVADLEHGLGGHGFRR